MHIVYREFIKNYQRERRKRPVRLKAEHISYKYPGGSREVLSDVSLELGSTDRLGIAAPSGFGKTTLCQILAGYRWSMECRS